MKILLITFFVLALASCGVKDADITVSGGTENTVTVDYKETQIKQVNGITYIRTSYNDIVSGCISIDASATYPASWTELSKANESRTVDYSNEELTECNQ